MSLTQDNTENDTSGPSVPTQREHPTVQPRVDLFAGTDALIVLAELPGVSAKDVSVHLDAQALQIEAVGRGATARSETGGASLSSVRYRRTLALDTGIDTDGIRVRMRNGLLHLHLPKTNAARSRRIPINT